MSRIRTFHRALIAIAIAVVCTTAVTAKQEQVMTRGFDRDKPFQVNDVDAIDILSGNLVLSVPLGGEYRSNGTLKYSFVMTYNSHIWDYQHIESGSFGRYIALEYNELVDMGDRITDEDLPPNVHGVESYPAPTFNGGLGWTVSLGELRDGYTYVSPDGASHRFYSTMTGTTTVQDGFGVPLGGKLYTRDSSYLRMTKVTDRERLIEFPDGIRKTFKCNLTNTADCDRQPSPGWLLDEIADPFGNLLYVTRVPAVRPTTGGSTWTWTYTEVSKTVPPSTSDVATYIQRNEGTTVRSHTFTFLIPTGKTYETRLTSAAVAAKGGPATYTFTYKDRDIYRDRGSNWGGTGLRVPFNAANKVSISTLTQINPPLNAGPWQFTYTEIATGDNDLNEVVWGSRTFSTSKQDGHLRSVTLPTGGRVEYDYEGRSIPARSCSAGRKGVAQFGPLGVSKRRVYAAGKSTPMGEWSYHTSRYQSAKPTAGATCNQFKEFVVTTIGPKMPNPPPNPNPAEHRTVTVSFFSAYHDDFDDKGGRPWVKEEHGLPFTKEVDDGSSRYLSELTFSCAADAFDSGGIDAMRRLIDHRRTPTETSTCGLPLRKKYVRYEHSGLDCSGEDGMCLASQTRVASTREVYPAQTGGDVETYLDTSNTGFDGLGHYRTLTTGGNLFKTVFPQVAGSDERISVTNYNPGVEYNANQQTVTLPARWLLGDYDRTEVKERRNGSPNAAFNVAATEYDYAPSTGFLRRVRRLSSTTGTRSSNDLLQTFERSNVSDSTVKILERSYGGDSVSQSKLFDDALPTTVLPDKPEYVIERRLQYGATQLVQYVGCDLIEVIHKVEDNTVDAASGLVTTSKAGNGALSSYDYDVLGRLTLFTPQGETATSYSYSAASGTSGPKVTATRSVPGDTIAESITADGFGRVALRKSRIPDNPNGLPCTDCWNAQQTTYYVDGQVATSSVVRGENQDFGARMSWHFYDALGRKVMAQTPDNAKTTYLHFGTWHVQENVSTLGARDLFYDRHGRLIKVTQGSGMPFRYEYDVAGRLAKTIAIQGNDRDRSTFWYDNRGFLFHELHPELGAQGIKYQYDSRGNPIAKFFPGEPTDYALDMRYDGAERLTDVIRGDKVIKHYAFHPTSTPMAGGQIALAQRLNIVPKPGLTQISTEYTVTTQYAYNPNSGRLASTTVGSSNGFGARTEYGWDSLGQLTTLRYPDLCAAAAPCSRTVSQTFRNGLLRSVGDFASSIAYFPNGMARKIVHTNGTHDEIGLAENEMPRPARIEFLRTSTQQTFERFGSASDPITYNGAGNITRVPRLSGSDTFGYDDLGRVTAGTVNARLQSYAYDNYGNLVSTTTDGVSRNLAVKTTLTNQLAAGDYDHAGHLRNIPDPRQGVPAGSKYVFEWDSQGMMKHHSASNLGRVFLYDAFDERVATIDYVTPSNILTESWTARDISNRVLSDFERIGTGAFTRKRDYIHRGSNVLAVVEGDTIQHLHPDHLGTPRLITSANGTVALHRDYFPFGEELVERDEPSRLEFTGHERDSDGTLANGSDIDYMHARYYVPAFGRFLSVDPVLGKAKAPQSWNRYAYASNNPVRRVDPDGRQDMLTFAVRDYHLRKAGLTDEQIQMMYREEAKATAAGVVMGGAGYGGITWRMVKTAIGIAALKETGATVRGTSKGSLGQHAANVAVDAGVGVASGGLANIATSENVAAALAGGGAGGFFEGFFGPEITTAKEKLGKAFDGLADYMKEKAAEAMDPFDCWD